MKMISRQYYSDDDRRKHQIDTLKIFNDHVIEIKENSEYRIEFAAQGFNMSLEVVLSPDFPDEKPVIFVNPKIAHPWVAENGNMVIGAPGLLNFTIHSDLGRVVQAIIREFSKCTFHTGLEELLSTAAPLSPRSQNLSLSSYTAMAFPEINELSNEELQELAENTDLQDKFLENCPQLIELELQTEDLMGKIENIAKENLSKQQMLDDLKTDVIDRISNIVQLKCNYEELNKKHQKLCEAYDPYKIRASLHDAALKADEDAEMIAEQFLGGEISVEAFVEKFGEKRALGQARRAKAERLAHQLAQLDRATS